MVKRDMSLIRVILEMAEELSSNKSVSPNEYNFPEHTTEMVKEHVRLVREMDWMVSVGNSIFMRESISPLTWSGHDETGAVAARPGDDSMTMDGTPDAAAILAEMRVKVEADIQKMVDSMPEEWQASY